MWDEEERILSDMRGAYFSPILGPNRGKDYGSTGTKYKPVVSSSKEPDLGRGSPVIDKSHDRIPDQGEGGVRLNWTKAPKKLIPPQTRTQTLARNDSHQSTGSTSSSSSSSITSSGRGNKRATPASPRDNQRRPVLPPDAVDLIVEDDEAAEEITKDKRITDPARGPLNVGLRKVYRRGYVSKDPEGQDAGRGEIEIKDEPESSSQGREDTANEIEGVEGDVEVIIAEDGEERLVVVEDEDDMVLKADSPPAHARALLDESLRDEDNPWA